MLTTQPNKKCHLPRLSLFGEYLECVSSFGCVVSICSACVVKLMKLFS